MNGKFIPLPAYIEYPPEEMLQRAIDFYQDIKRRRTVRDFSDRSVPIEVIKQCILAAGTAASGANLQPWHFAVVSDPEVKKQIRIAAEQEEQEFYNGRAPQEWLDALEPLGTDANKPFLTTAPYLIAVFAKSYELFPNRKKVKNYYVQESVGLAAGTLINALHHAGLVTLTHTPSPMNFLNKLLNRPKNERPILLIVIGYPASDAQVPFHATLKKPLDQIASFI